MHEKLPHVAVAALANAKQTLLAARAVLARREPQACREVAPLRERLAVAQSARQRTGRQRADTAQFHQPVHHRVVLDLLGDMRIQLPDALVEMTQIVSEVCEQRAKRDRQAVLRILEPLGERTPQLFDADRRNEAVLANQSTYLVGLRRALPTNSSRIRCAACVSCWDTDFTATNRIPGRPIASQIASASARSFLLLLTYGLTN